MEYMEYLVDRCPNITIITGRQRTGKTRVIREIAQKLGEVDKYNIVRIASRHPEEIPSRRHVYRSAEVEMEKLIKEFRTLIEERKELFVGKERGNYETLGMCRITYLFDDVLESTHDLRVLLQAHGHELTRLGISVMAAGHRDSAEELLNSFGERVIDYHLRLGSASSNHISGCTEGDDLPLGMATLDCFKINKNEEVSLGWYIAE